jgi:hypothetical protein
MTNIKTVELEDNQGNKAFVNPASVCLITETENYEHMLEGQPEKLVVISTIGFSITVKAPIEEVRKLIFGN